jgi:L-seryl-tRNA(Ser) seleniumtransferase
MRSIPSIEQLRQRPAILELEARHGRSAIVDALRAEAAAVRASAGPGGGDIAERIERGAIARLAAASAPSLRRVINATGVIIHTNLGRAPLSRAAAERATELATGYTNLEYDIERGGRGKRDVHAERLICRLTGAQAAVVVNNNAAATLVVLAALAAGREVLISRGELVEIGGGFRVPDVMAQSGAVLREVGTTNRTRSADYAAALSEKTALILRVHPSNFRIEGFTERPALGDLVAIARRFSIPIAEDLGSGFVADAFRNVTALADEPDVRRSIAAGADVVMFSGDKLLGGPQAGIIAGSDALVARIRTHPLMRALRVDKLTYAALEATLEEYTAERASSTVPVPAMIGLPIEEIDRRARKLAVRIDAATAEIIDGESTIGGGSAPGSALPTRLVAIAPPHLTAQQLEERLRRHSTPIIARILDDRVVIDLRTVSPDDDEVIAVAIRDASAGAGDRFGASSGETGMR